MDLYQTLYNFCKLRNPSKPNGHTPRMNFIMERLKEMNLHYEIDAFQKKDFFSYYYNSGYNNDYNSGNYRYHNGNIYYYGNNTNSNVKNSGVRKIYNANIGVWEELSDDGHEISNVNNGKYYLPSHISNGNGNGSGSGNGNGKSKKKKNKNKKYHYNIYVKINHDLPYNGDSRIFLAHHDVNNANNDNTNDNSASVINLLYLALLLKNTGKPTFIVFTDCEETGMHGAKHLANRINEGYFGNVEYCVNLELTAMGEYYLVGDEKNSSLVDKIMDINPNTEKIITPPHDGDKLTTEGIDSTVVGILPKNDYGNFLKKEIFTYCHDERDNNQLIAAEDMKNFVENFLYPLS